MADEDSAVTISGEDLLRLLMQARGMSARDHWHLGRRPVTAQEKKERQARRMQHKEHVKQQLERGLHRGAVREYRAKKTNTVTYLQSRMVHGRRQNGAYPLIPNASVTRLSFGPKVFVSNFSQRGDIFVLATQGDEIGLFHTHEILHTGPTKPKPFKIIQALDVGWSVLDVDFSPDQRSLIYSSWCPYIHLCNVTAEGTQVHEKLLLDTTDWNTHFCAFSIRFSPDSREVLAGTNHAKVFVYDLEANQLALQAEGHRRDVNAVCFAEEDANNILFSGSDDCLCLVWDRRLMSHNRSPVGAFVGHTDGIVYIDSKGDGRYLITHSKDQSIKLWDIRKMESNPSGTMKQFCRSVAQSASELQPKWDYRHGLDTRIIHRVHPDDNSIMTYRGHSLSKSLLRAKFSPRDLTAQKYIYCGSGEGQVVIYDVLTGEIVRTLVGHDNELPVRDVSWHPHLPVIGSGGWDGKIVMHHYDPDNELEERELEQKRKQQKLDNPDNEDDNEGEEEEDEDEEEATPIHINHVNSRRAMLTRLMQAVGFYDGEEDADEDQQEEENEDDDDDDDDDERDNVSGDEA
eukprot:TRINITY_DN67305_c8_g13_i1.p1 TRINITY_DN67305_c8_g13~~TRINITY_DN67305_c8_g13_i1.p1  ORF type:complete len:572 (-),score=38.39 TRINITY_DN67305_c8_g13_i1:128-1843(-)